MKFSKLFECFKNTTNLKCENKFFISLPFYFRNFDKHKITFKMRKQ